MKRKIFSKLLMGAFLIASISSFVSCKDYDDDIKDIKADMQKLALQTSVENLQTQLTSAASTAQSALAKAEAAATQTALGDVKVDLAAVKAAAETAGENAAKGISDAAAAKSAADAAQGTADAAGVAAAAAADAAKAANDLAAQAKSAADAAQAAVDAAVAAGATKEAVAAVEAQAKAAQEAADKAAKDAADKAAAAQSAAEATAKTLAAEAQAAATNAAKAYTDAEIAKIKAEIAKMSFEEKDAKAMAEIEKIQAEVGKIASLQAEVAKLNALNSDVESLKNEIAALKVVAGDTKALDALTAKVDGYNSAIAELFKMVTNVELIGTYTGTVKNAIKLNNVGYYVPFIYGKQATDESFGNNEDKFFQFKKEDQITYKQGDDIRTMKTLLIRVNPTNAEFTKDQIQLVDSKGNDLSDVVTIGDPYRYTGLITRSIDNSGLWAVPVEVKDGVDKATFNKKVITTDKDYIAYAVAIKNENETDNRFVASTYDLTTEYVNYVPANYFNVSIATASGTTTINNLANRWANIYNADLAKAEDGIIGENGVDRQFTNPEYAWAIPGTPYDGIAANKSNVIQAGEALAKAGLVYTTPFMDRRGNAADDDYLQVDINETITLKDFNTIVRRYNFDTARNYYRTFTTSYAEYYYVTLDLANAVESRPSEENAWTSYEISGINKMTPADEDLEIVITDPRAAGDYIGFRVYAVNFDGTLVDPDGRAFYVHVAGEAPEQSAVVVNYVANTARTNFTGALTENVGTAEVTQTFASLVPDGGAKGDFNATITYGLKRSGASGDSRAYTVTTDMTDPAITDVVNVTYWVLDKDGNVAGNWDKIKSVMVQIDNPGPIVNNSSLPSILISGRTLNTGAVPVVNELYIAPRKVLPTTSPVAVEWRASLEPVNGVLTVYPQPAEFTTIPNTAGKFTATPTVISWNNVSSTTGDQASWNNTSAQNLLYKDLTNYINNESKFVDWVVAAKAGLDNKAISLFNVTPNHVAISQASKMGQTYNSNVIYSYDDLSTYYDYTQKATGGDNGWQYEADHHVNAWEGKIKYANAMDLFTFGVKPQTWNWTDASVTPSVDHSASTTEFFLKWRTEVKGATSAAPVTKFYWNKVETHVNTANVTTQQNFVTTIANLVRNTTSTTNRQIATNAGITGISNVATATVEFSNYNNIEVSITGAAGTIVSAQLDSYTAPTQIEFFKKQPTATTTTVDDPVRDVTGNVVITGKDIFGVAHTIVTIPFTVKFNL